MAAATYGGPYNNGYYGGRDVAPPVYQESQFTYSVREEAGSYVPNSATPPTELKQAEPAYSPGPRYS